MNDRFIGCSNRFIGCSTGLVTSCECVCEMPRGQFVSRDLRSGDYGGIKSGCEYQSFSVMVLCTSTKPLQSLYLLFYFPE